jgi:AraC-like DNA-binding protein
LDRFIKEWGYDYDLETIGHNLLPKFRANYLSGRKDSALRVAMQIAEVYDTALVRQKRSESAELATIYDTQGKERQIAEQRAGKRLFTAISIASGILALLIFGFAVYVFRQWRSTKKKNRVLVDQINEVLEYKKKYKELRNKVECRTENIEYVTSPEGSTVSSAEANSPLSTLNSKPTGLSISDMTELTDEQLFLCLRDLIENEQLFLQPDFGRQTLIEHTGLSKERIGAAFAQGSDSVSLPAYVRELRLDFAVRMMNDQPDIAVELVSQASGFTNADTFTRNFRAKYGMTPTTYKQTLNND